MRKTSRDYISELTKARQDVIDAEARVSALEAVLNPSENTLSQPSFFHRFLTRFDVRVSIGYGIIATLWILFSDHLLTVLMTEDLQLSANFSLIKGLTFVWVTALILFTLLYAELRKRNRIAQALERDLVHRKQADENVKKLHRVLSLLSDINQSIVRIRHIPTLFEETCAIAVEKGAFRMAWIGLLDSKTRQVTPVAHAGFVDNYLEKLNISLDDEVRGRGQTGTALLSGKHVIISDIEHDPTMQPWREDARRLGYASSAALPLIISGEVRGVLNLYSDEPDFFDAAEIRLIDEMAGDLSFAMEFAEQEARGKQAQAALLENEGRYHRMLDDLLEGAEIIGFDWRYLYVNDTSAAHGRQVKEVLLRSTVLELYPGIENTPLFAFLRTCMEERTVQRFESEFVFPDGATAWFKLSVQPVPEGIFILSLDITERKQAEVALSNSEAQQRAILSAIPDIMFRYAADGTFLDYHAPEADLLAVPPEAFLGKKPRDVLPLALAQRLEQQIQHIVKTKESVLSEYAMPVSSGTREFESRLVPVGENEALGIIRDVTERKLAEQELKSLYDATSYLFKADSLLNLGKQIVAAIIHEFEYADCGLMLLDKSQNKISRLARSGQMDIQPDTTLTLEGPGLVPLALRTGKIIYAPDVAQDVNYVRSDARTQSEFVIPLITANGAIGALDLQRPHKDAFSERDQRILTAYAERAAPAIETMRLYEEINLHAADLEWRVAQRTVELNQAKERAEAILNHSIDSIVLMDSNLLIQQTNLAFDTLFAVEPDTYFEKPFSTLLSVQDEKTMQQMMLNRESQRIEITAQRKNGTVFDAEFGIGFIKNNGVVCIIRDITERKRAEKATAEERNLLRTLIDALPDYIYVKDTQHRTLLSNLARTRSFGLTSPEETIGKDDYAFVPAEMAAQFHADEDRLFQTLEPLIDRQERTVGPHGGVIWAATTKVPLHNLNGELIGLVGVTRDISEQKMREQQLRFDAGIQASVSDAVIVTDTEFRIQSWNKAAEIIYGWSAAEAIGKPAEILQTRFESEEAEDQARVSLFSQGQMQADYIQQRKDGSELYVQASTSVFKDESGLAIGVVSVNRDITERKRVEEALRQSEQLLRTVLNILPVGVWMLDKNGIITYGNPAAQQIWAGAQYVGMEDYGVFKAWWVDTGSRLEPHEWGAARAIATGESYLDEELEIEAFDGTHKFMINSAVPLRDQEQKVIGAVVLNLDITVRKQIEQALRESENRFRSLIDAAPIATVITNAQGQITLINQQAENIFGYTSEEIIGQPVEILIPISARSQHPDHRASYMAQPRVRQMSKTKEFNALGKNGSEFRAEIELSYVNTRDGLLVMSFVMDITERKNAQETLRQSEERYRLLAENITDVICRLTPDGIYKDVSPSSTAVFGYTPEEMIGKHRSDFIHPDDKALWEQKLHMVLEQRSEMPLTYRFRRRDGHYIWLEVARKFIISPDGGIVQEYVTSSRDVTVRKRAEEALKNALEKEKELSELKSRFVSTASHEFRTPLATILAVVETLSAYRKKLVDEQIDDKLSKISDQVLYLKAIIEDMLQLVRLQNPKVRHDPVKLNLDAVCRSVIDEFESRPDVNRQFVYSCDDTLQEVALDRKLMRQIISNLVSNAVKYSAPNKTITISLKQTDTGLSLKIQDEGIGIPEADLKHLFEPFHRAANVGTIPGTGLGLAITKESVELHGGSIAVESHVGLGTTFTITIPFAAETGG